MGPARRQLHAAQRRRFSGGTGTAPRAPGIASPSRRSGGVGAAAGGRYLKRDKLRSSADAPPHFAVVLRQHPIVDAFERGDEPRPGEDVRGRARWPASPMRRATSRFSSSVSIASAIAGAVAHGDEQAGLAVGDRLGRAAGAAGDDRLGRAAPPRRTPARTARGATAGQNTSMAFMTSAASRRKPAKRTLSRKPPARAVCFELVPQVALADDPELGVGEAARASAAWRRTARGSPS